MDQEPGNDPLRQFHDRESEDVYDLYNACNGVMRDGRLDIRKLDDLSKEEREILDVARLKELWHHIDAGCGTCETIIKKIDLTRAALKGQGAAAGRPRVLTTRG